MMKVAIGTGRAGGPSPSLPASIAPDDPCSETPNPSPNPFASLPPDPPDFRESTTLSDHLPLLALRLFSFLPPPLLRSLPARRRPCLRGPAFFFSDFTAFLLPATWDKTLPFLAQACQHNPPVSLHRFSFSLRHPPRYTSVYRLRSRCSSCNFRLTQLHF